MTIRNAMVLAAGLGTRLKPVTDSIPKPLVKIAGKPMIEYGLEALIEAGVTTAVVNVHHFADQMEAYLCRSPAIPGAKPLHIFAGIALNILISDERGGLLDSGGGLARGLKMLDRTPAYVMNADLFWIGDEPGEKSNLTRLGAFFDPVRMDMALLCVSLENTTGHNGRIDFSMDEAGRLTRFGPESGGKPVIYAGAMVINPGLLDDAPEGAFNLNIYFDRAIAKRRLFGTMMSGHWITVGTPEAIDEAEAVIANLTKGE